MKSGREFLHSFVRHKLAMIGLIIFLAEIVLVLVLPPVMHLDPTAIDSTHFSAAPGGSHILGTDDVGRDMFARVVCGGRISILIGVAATAISVVIGLPLGLFAGYYRGKAETIIMRAADIFLSFPSMVLILVIVAVFGSSIPALIILIGVLNWPAIAKLIYGNVLSVRSMEYVEAERAIGTPSLKILFQTVMPNSIAPLWVSLSFRISNAMITESALSFLGAGVQPPTPSWGNIIQNATSLVVLTQRWWIWIPAGLCLVVTIFCINFIGEGVRDALDPKMKRM
ncbi:MAG: ABC transporter permease [Lachnospiraceae bacterium]|jgi:peptide/nickel transport system permease protein|nr:ABC transporter permease [Lachnospiraceae bacterium]MCH4069974.1 ABC transporter permease [Lachnospiraceae bacterium]MCH4108673.1 ABC transporter permease [Lachnospiraceae bacterium]MCI1302824.1 ABC transporter permease [Lachnospiraceae bacterium]MCI1332039.1 ABC transporter permease [Lachnospiraceae bacterium]